MMIVTPFRMKYGGMMADEFRRSHTLLLFWRLVTYRRHGRWFQKWAGCRYSLDGERPIDCLISYPPRATPFRPRLVIPRRPPAR